MDSDPALYNHPKLRPKPRAPLFRVGLSILISLLVIGVSSCEKIREVEEFFKKPPVIPVNRAIKNAALAGFAGTLVSAWYQNESLSGVTTWMNKSTAVFYADMNQAFPFRFSDDRYGQSVFLAIRISDELAVVSILLGESSFQTGSYTLSEIRTFPVLLTEQGIKVVYASNDINIGGPHELEIQLTPDQIQFEIQRSQTEAAQNEAIAIDQNAWVIEVDDSQTPGNAWDDHYLVSGGEQRMAIMDGEIPAATTLQLAMVGMAISPSCSQNPTQGLAFMQNLSVSGNPGDLVLAQALLDFGPACDGTVKVTAAFGNYITWFGKRLNLNLSE